MSPPIDQKGGSAPSEELDQSDQTETASQAASGFPGPIDERYSGFSVRHSDVVPKNPDAVQDDGFDDPEVIVHEIGNKIAVLQTALALVEKKLPKTLLQDETVSEGLKISHEELDGIGHILRRVRASAQNNLSPLLPEEVPEHVIIDLSETIEAQVKLWRRVLRTKIAITRDFAPEIIIRGDHLELDELIHNVFKNGIEIMKDLPEEERRLHVRIRKKKGFIQLFVHDNGPGISPEDKEKLFKKRFTRKKGKGIGLFWSQKLARKMGGDIVLMNTKDLLEIKDRDERQEEVPAVHYLNRRVIVVPPKNGVQWSPPVPGLFKKFVSLMRGAPGESDEKIGGKVTHWPRKINIADFRGAVAIIEFPDPEEEVR